MPQQNKKPIVKKLSRAFQDAKDKVREVVEDIQSTLLPGRAPALQPAYAPVRK